MKGKVFCSRKETAGDKKDLESHGISGRMDEIGKSEDSGAQFSMVVLGEDEQQGSEKIISGSLREARIAAAYIDLAREIIWEI